MNKNKYFKWYWNICENAKNRKLSEEIYVENHHIYPKSIYGKNNKIVPLTAKEHYMVHLLLWRAFRQEYGKSDEKTRKMAYAFTMMKKFNKNQKRYDINNSNEYSFYKIASIESQKGKKHSEETKNKISQKNKELFKDSQNNPFYSKKHSEETKNKISKAVKKRYNENPYTFGMKNKKHSEITKIKMCKPHKKSNIKRILSEETKEKIRQSLSGKKSYWYQKKRTIHTKEKMSLKRKEYLNDNRLEKNKLGNRRKKTVYQYDKDNNLINIFESVREAEKNTGIHRNNIASCARKELYFSGGFKWSYNEL